MIQLITWLFFFTVLLFVKSSTAVAVVEDNVDNDDVMEVLMKHKTSIDDKNHDTTEHDYVRVVELQALLKQQNYQNQQEGNNNNKIKKQPPPLKCDPTTNLASIGNFNFDCHNIDLYSVLTGDDLGSKPYYKVHDGKQTSINDIWGWTDYRYYNKDKFVQNQKVIKREYAIVGLWDGTSFVDITDPLEPHVIGFMNATIVNTTDRRLRWHDIKVYENTAYVGSEQYGHGIQVFDLTRLRNLSTSSSTSSSVVNVVPYLEPDNVLKEVGKTHNLVVANEASKLLGVGFNKDPTLPLCGYNKTTSSIAIYDISQDPINPEFESCYYDERIGYVHDAHCINYNGPDTRYVGKNICALFGGSMIHIIDIDLAAAASASGMMMDDDENDDAIIINTFVYPNCGYAHQGMFSEDHTTLYVDDEIDEILQTVTETTTQIIIFGSDITNPYPKFHSFQNNIDTPDTYWIHPNIDHNLLIKNDLIYQASYTAGARIRRIVNDKDKLLEEVGYFDMEQNCEHIPKSIDGSMKNLTDTCNAFAGVWTYYPYFDSGITIAGSRYQGLFLLKPTL